MTQSKDTTLHTRQSENSHKRALFCFVFAHLFTCLLIVCTVAVIFWCRCCDKDYFSFQQTFLPFDTAGLLEPSPPRNRNGYRNRNKHRNRTDLGIETDLGTERPRNRNRHGNKNRLREKHTKERPMNRNRHRIEQI